MKHNFLYAVLALVLFSFSSAQAEIPQVGSYTFDAQGYVGEASIQAVQGAQGVFSFVAETVKESNGNLCSFEGSCVVNGEALLCTNSESPDARVLVQGSAHGIEVSGENTNYFCGNAVFFTGNYVRKSKSAAAESGFKVEVLEFVDYEEESAHCGALYANKLDDYACLSFKRTDASQKDVHMWRGYALPSAPTKRADLLVAYVPFDQGNVFLAAMANPRLAAIHKEKVVFLGEDEEAPESGFFMFKNSLGNELYLVCKDAFCAELHQHKGKSMEITHQAQYYYHQGGESFVEEDFVLGYTVLP